MRKTLYILSLLTIFSLILAACGGTAPADTGGEPAAEEPAAEEPAAEEPAAEEPAAEEPAEDSEMMGAPEFKNPDTYVYVTFGDP